jgi:hypothetical protein
LFYTNVAGSATTNYVTGRAGIGLRWIIAERCVNQDICNRT